MCAEPPMAAILYGIEGMTEAESRALLELLFEHGDRPEFTLKFRWQKAQSPSGTIAAPSI
jgi:alpha-ketoglutarate-dependent taurine dioxygenase